MAFDVGLKRIGIAVTDSGRIIATSLDTLSPKDIGVFLKDYLAREQVTDFVIGKPMTASGKDSESMPLVKQFADWLMHHYGEGRQLHWIDERYTSRMARRSLAESGLKKKERENKALTDSVSATLILQTFLLTNS